MSRFVDINGNAFHRDRIASVSKVYIHNSNAKIQIRLVSGQYEQITVRFDYNDEADKDRAIRELESKREALLKQLND